MPTTHVDYLTKSIGTAGRRGNGLPREGAKQSSQECRQPGFGGGGPQIVQIETAPLLDHDGQHVAPLAVGDLAARVIPEKLLQKNVFVRMKVGESILGGRDPTSCRSAMLSDRAARPRQGGF